VEQDIGWNNITVVAHQAKFDGFILRNIYAARPGSWIDTKGMSRAVLSKSIKGHSLAVLSDHFGLPRKEIEKLESVEGVRDLTPEQEESLAGYCCGDVSNGTGVFDRLATEFPANQYPYLSWSVEALVNPRLELDLPLLEKCAEEERAQKKKKFEALAVDKSVFSSNEQFAALLTARGYTVPFKPSPKKKGADGKPLLIPALALQDPAFLDMLTGPDEDLRTLCEARKAAKSTQLETRADSFIQVGRTGLWPFDYEFSGADQTHRGSGGPEGGGNPQNLTRGSALRAAVMAVRGQAFLYGDLAAIELRINGYLCGDQWIIQAIEQGRDVYCEFASSFYKRLITPDNKPERKFGKTGELALGYNMGWRKFQARVRTETGQSIIDIDAKRAVALYRSRHVRIVETWHYLDKMIGCMTEKGKTGRLGSMPIKYGFEYLELPSGLKMRYPNLRQEPGKHGPQWVCDAYRKGKLEKNYLYGGKILENICQALAGEICKEAALPFLGTVTGMVHDEIHRVVPHALALIESVKLRRVMSQSPSWMPNLKLDAEVGWGRNWLEAK
jgi:DNA polymerase